MATNERDLLRRLRERLRAENEQLGLYERPPASEAPESPPYEGPMRPDKVALLEGSIERSFEPPSLMERLTGAIRNTGGPGQNLKDLLVEGGRQLTDVHVPRTMGGIRETMAGGLDTIADAAGELGLESIPVDMPRGPRAIQESLRYGADRDFAASDAAAAEAAERTSSPGAVTGRVLAELGATGAEYMTAGRFLRGPGVKGAPVVPEALKDALAVLPLDVATTTRPEDSSAAFLAEVAPEEAQPLLDRIAASPAGRAAFEAAFGLTGDLALRGAGRGLSRGAEALTERLPSPFDIGQEVDESIRGFADEFGQSPPAEVQPEIRGLLPRGPLVTPAPGSPEDFAAWFRNESLMRGAAREATERETLSTRQRLEQALGLGQEPRALPGPDQAGGPRLRGAAPERVAEEAAAETPAPREATPESGALLRPGQKAVVSRLSEDADFDQLEPGEEVFIDAANEDGTYRIRVEYGDGERVETFDGIPADALEPSSGQDSRAGIALPEVAGVIGRTGAGAAAGAVVDEEDPLRGAAVGAAAINAPAVVKHLQAKPGRPEIDAAAARELERADVELPKAPEGTTGPARAPYAGDVEVEDHINLAAYQLDPEGEAVLRREVEKVVREEHLAPKTVESHKRVSEVAASLGLSPTDLARPDAFANRYEMVAMRNVIDRNVRLMSNVEKELATATHVDGPKKGQPLNPQEIAARESAVQGLESQTDALLNRFIRQRTEDGRNLAAHKILANQTTDVTTWVARAKRKLGGVTPATEIIGAIQKGLDEGDIEGVAKLVKELERSPVSEQLSALWKAGLLSAPTTHTVNTVSTAGNLLLEGFKDPPAAVGDRMLTGALRLAASAGAKLRGHVKPNVGRSKSTGSGLKTLARGSRRGIADIRRTLQGKAASTEAARKWDWRETKIDFVPTWLGGKRINPVLDGYQRFVFRALSAQDKFFKAIRVEQSILDQARVAAINEGSKNPAKRAAELYDAWRADGYRALPDDVAMQAIYDGEVATFTDKSTLSRIASMPKTAARNAAKDGSAAGSAALMATEAIAPFTGTPSNVVSRVVEYTPLGLAGAVYDASRLVARAYAGKGIEREAQRRAVEMFGRSVTGGGLLALGYLIHNEGLMTLGYPESSGERGNWELTGKQEFSVFMESENGEPGRWHSLERFSPIGNLLAVGGYVARSSQRAEEDPEAGALDIATDATFGLANMVVSQSFMEGTARFLNDLMMTEAGDESAKGRFVKNQARSVVPNMIRRIAQAMDTDASGQVIIRETETWQDAIRSAIPVMREKLPIARDALGSHLTRKSSAEEFIDVSYSRLDRSQMDAVRREMARLDAPITPRRRDRAGGETAEQYSARARTEGKELWEGLYDLFRSDAYRVSVIDQAREMAVRPQEVRELTDAFRRELIAETIRSTRTAQTRERRERASS